MRGSGAVMAGIAVMVAGPALAESPAAAQRAIEARIASAGVAWSKGDLDGFMTLYERSPSASYVTGDKRVQGYDAIREMYAADFGAGSAKMGQLDLDVLEVRPVGASHAYVLVRFTLRQDGEEPASGLSTLLMRRGAGGWKVLADHS